MQQLEYRGFANNACACHYKVAELNGKTVVIFKQLDLVRNTSITNVIEQLIPAVMAQDWALSGKREAEVRFFSFYPPELKPLAVWQEVWLNAERQPAWSAVGIEDRRLLEPLVGL